MSALASLAGMERSGARYPVTARATVGGRGFLKVPVSILDISTRGCRIEARAQMYKGVIVTVAVAGRFSVDARVMWAKARQAGLLFTVPLNYQIIRELVADHPAQGDS